MTADAIPALEIELRSYMATVAIFINGIFPFRTKLRTCRCVVKTGFSPTMLQSKINNLCRL